MKRETECLRPRVNELPKTAQRAGTAEPADYRLVPRIAYRPATEPLYCSTIEIIKARKHAPLLTLTPPPCHHRRNRRRYRRHYRHRLRPGKSHIRPVPAARTSRRCHIILICQRMTRK